MKLILISDPSSVHTRNWIDGLEANDVEVELVFVKSWILRKGQLPEFIEKRTTLIDVPSFSGLVSNSFRNLSLGGLLRDLRHRTRMHQTIRFVGERIKEFANQRNVDIIHSHGLASSILLAYSSGVRPYSASAWGSDIYIMPDRYQYLKPIMAKAISEAAFIHVESKLSADRVKNLSCSSLNKIFVSTWGVDTETYRPHQSTSEMPLNTPQKYILSFRSLGPLYRINIIIEAFAILIQEIEDVDLVVGGDGPLREELENLTRNLGIEDRVTFTGFIDADQKRTLFSNAQLYVQCPESDGVSLAMMEAMSSGLPLVSSNVGETSVLVQSEENGFLVDNPSPENLAKAMLQILNDEAMRTRMSQKSRILAMEKHNRTKFFQNFVRFVNSVIENES